MLAFLGIYPLNNWFLHNNAHCTCGDTGREIPNQEKFSDVHGCTNKHSLAVLVLPQHLLSKCACIRAVFIANNQTVCFLTVYSKGKYVPCVT